MKTLVYLSAILVSTLLTGCGGSGSHPSTSYPPSAPAVLSDTIRVGDKITVQLSGVPEGEYFNEKQIPASGDITLPLLNQPFHAVGKTAGELGAEITQAYKTQKIYSNPVINVQPEERFVNVGGDVRSPSNVLWRPDSSVMSAINACGGFTDYANRRTVRVIRGQQVIIVDCNKAVQTTGADPAVYPGDQIFVPRTMF
jgi:protein involved in polysaccharide export with SLBB domain